jgi:hypothetical protein
VKASQILGGVWLVVALGITASGCSKPNTETCGVVVKQAERLKVALAELANHPGTGGDSVAILQNHIKNVADAVNRAPSPKGDLEPAMLEWSIAMSELIGAIHTGVPGAYEDKYGVPDAQKLVPGVRAKTDVIVGMCQ